MSNPYRCSACGGEMEHDLDCGYHPANLARQAEEEDNRDCRGE